jgi:16S rRNA (cytidine1402-2'-O)-methyltransferase
MPPSDDIRPGTLYVVATPIGNLQDITLRALKVLSQVDLIAAEDTRQTGQLLKHHGIPGRMIAYHDHNEATRAAELLDRLQAGASVAVVSDAGTPTVSDPGYRLVAAAAAAGLPVVPVPGVSAPITALSVSGLATDAFCFVGFLPRKAGARRARIDGLAGREETLIFYESPRRVGALITLLIEILGDRPAVVGREMTKPYEEFLRGPLSVLKATLEKRPAIRGEVTVLVAGATQPMKTPEAALQAALLAEMHDGHRPLAEIVRAAAQRFNVPRKTVYSLALKIRRESAQEE